MKDVFAARIISDQRFPTSLTKQEIEAGFKIEAILIGFATAEERMSGKRTYTKVAVRDVRRGVKLLKTDGSDYVSKGYQILAYGISPYDENKIVKLGWETGWIFPIESIKKALHHFETTQMDHNIHLLDPPEDTVKRNP